MLSHSNKALTYANGYSRTQKLPGLFNRLLSLRQPDPLSRGQKVNDQTVLDNSYRIESISLPGRYTVSQCRQPVDRRASELKMAAGFVARRFRSRKKIGESLWGPRRGTLSATPLFETLFSYLQWH